MQYAPVPAMIVTDGIRTKSSDITLMELAMPVA